MKKLLFIILVVIFSSIYAFADDINWHLANQITIGWNNVTTLVDGTSVPSDQVSYNVYIAKLEDKSDKIEVATNIIDNQYTITLNSEGKRFVGVMAVRTIDNTTINSSISWSDDPLSCENNETFGIMLYLSPSNVEGLKIVNTQ